MTDTENLVDAITEDVEELRRAMRLMERCAADITASIAVALATLVVKQVQP